MCTKKRACDTISFMQIYHFELKLEEGFTLLDKENKEDRLWRGRRVSACSGWPLFSTMRGTQIKCWQCGCVADRWIADQGRNNKMGYPVVNLYSLRDNKITLMTRDHIIPKSLGGCDANENLRPACEVCNGERGNDLSPEELKFRQDNMHLVLDYRVAKGKEAARKKLAGDSHTEEEKQRTRELFALIGEPL